MATGPISVFVETDLGVSVLGGATGVPTGISLV